MDDTAWTTLCIDIGGTGLKAALVDTSGNMLSDRVREEVVYPMEPAGENGLVPRLRRLVSGLPTADRVSVGFPGRVHRGKVVTGAKFTGGGPGTEPDPELVLKWKGFDLRAALTTALGLPVRVANDADVQGLGVVVGPGRGKLLEVAITLGTGLGSALFEDGVLLPHLELAHHPFRKGETYEQQLGDAARVAVGNERWNARLAEALNNFAVLFDFHRLYLGGGNAKKVDQEVITLYDGKVEVVANTAGILGGVRLWEMPAALFE